MIIVPTEKRFEWNNAPIALFLIVTLNVLVFYAYQTGDWDHLEEAVTLYVNDGIFEKEVPHYRDYLTQIQAFEELEYFRQIEQHPNRYAVAAVLIQDENFYHHLMANGSQLFDAEYHAYWQYQRLHIHDLMHSVSYQKYGLTANDISITALITHQFLHADTMHLVANMFFLIICGFAVEATLGHRNFMLFYLITGVGGGLAQAFTDLESTVPLIGASGAVSGVMAMYLGIFRLKKIEFFYWFFVFVGYFRAPALFILPFYIGNELISLWSQPESNVAFMAHIGGFVMGTVLIALVLLMKPDILNRQYIEEDQSAAPDKISLDGIYQNLEKFKFASAIKALDQHMKSYGSDFDLHILKYKLLLVTEPSKAASQFNTIIHWPNPSKAQLRTIKAMWLDLSTTKEQLNPELQYKLAWNFITDTEHIDHAVKIFNDLLKAENKHPTLNLLAKKIAFVYKSLENQAESEKYQNMARELS